MGSESLRRDDSSQTEDSLRDPLWAEYPTFVAVVAFILVFQMPGVFP